MKIALVGYGKMGKAIEQIALQHGHSIVLKIDRDNSHELDAEHLAGVDVAIEFSRPDTAFDNVRRCLELGVPVVCGTTAWLDKFETATQLCQAKNGALLYASNFSVGVNIMFALSRQLSRYMAGQPQYEPHIHEIHHVHKLDAPSGTGVTLAETITAALDRYKSWTLDESLAQDQVYIKAERIGEVPGTHSVIWHSEIDDIEIKHTAHSRVGFASGAVLAAEWLHGKQGVYGMADVLGL